MNSLRAELDEYRGAVLKTMDSVESIRPYTSERVGCLVLDSTKPSCPKCVPNFALQFALRSRCQNIVP